MQHFLKFSMGKTLNQFLLTHKMKIPRFSPNLPASKPELREKGSAWLIICSSSFSRSLVGGAGWGVGRGSLHNAGTIRWTRVDYTKVPQKMNLEMVMVSNGEMR